MKWLAIETATERATVALQAGNEIKQIRLGDTQRHAQNILPAVESLLMEAGFDVASLDGIVFGRGPGSFTGVRVACSVAQGLAYGCDIPLYPVSTLATIEYSVPSEHPSYPILVMMDARMRQLYWKFTDINLGNTKECVDNAADIQISSEISKVIVAGCGLDAYIPQLQTTVLDKIIAQYEIWPEASVMIKLVQQGKINPVTIAEALPVYIRDQVTNNF